MVFSASEDVPAELVLTLELADDEAVALASLLVANAPTNELPGEQRDR
jgi:hypothetical protein